MLRAAVFVALVAVVTARVAPPHRLPHDSEDKLNQYDPWAVADQVRKSSKVFFFL